MAAQTPDPVLTLEAAFEQALRANPTVEAARRRQIVATEAIGVASERPNPDLRVEFERETPTRAYTLAVPIETGGKRGRRIDLGNAGVAVSGAELARAMLDVRSSVRREYFALAAVEQQLTLLRELLDVASRARDAAQQRFDAGSSPRLDVLQAELARADAENQATAAEGGAAAARARLNALLAQPPETAVVLATPIDAGLVVPPAAAGPGAPIPAEVAVFDRQLDEQRARIALAAAMRAPDLTPEAALTRGAEPEFSTGWRAGVGLTVPLFTRHQAGVRVEEAALAALTAEREAAAIRIAGDIAAARATAEALSRQYLRYQSSLVPQAIEIERLAEESYRLGRTGLAAYLQALQATRDVRRGGCKPRPTSNPRSPTWSAPSGHRCHDLRAPTRVCRHLVFATLDRRVCREAPEEVESETVVPVETTPALRATPRPGPRHRHGDPAPGADLVVAPEAGTDRRAAERRRRAGRRGDLLVRFDIPAPARRRPAARRGRARRSADPERARRPGARPKISSSGASPPARRSRTPTATSPKPRQRSPKRPSRARGGRQRGGASRGARPVRRSGGAAPAKSRRLRRGRGHRSGASSSSIQADRGRGRRVARRHDAGGARRVGAAPQRERR